MHTCVKQLLLLGFLQCIPYGGAFAWKHLLAFMHTAHCLTVLYFNNIINHQQGPLEEQ